MSRIVDWYFDVISPYAYLQMERLHELPGDVQVRYRPVLLAALLNHWGQLGPVEIPPKRLFTFRHVHWLARCQGVELELPAAHPFNPLRQLRLAVLAGDDHERVREIFRFTWVHGRSADDLADFGKLLEATGFEDRAADVDAPATKSRLMDNARDAIDAGVFGVPTFLVDGMPIWGVGATEMAIDMLAGKPPTDIQWERSIRDLPHSAQRRRP